MGFCWWKTFEKSGRQVSVGSAGDWLQGRQAMWGACCPGSYWMGGARGHIGRRRDLKCQRQWLYKELLISTQRGFYCCWLCEETDGSNECSHSCSDHRARSWGRVSCTPRSLGWTPQVPHLCCRPAPSSPEFVFYSLWRKHWCWRGEADWYPWHRCASIRKQAVLNGAPWGQNEARGGRATGGQTRPLQRPCVGKDNSQQGLEWDMKEHTIKPAGTGVQRKCLVKIRAGSGQAWTAQSRGAGYQVLGWGEEARCGCPRLPPVPRRRDKTPH